MKKILVVGDSYFYGHGCSDRIYYYDTKTKLWVGQKHNLYAGPSKFAWSALLQKRLPNWQVINLSMPGNDNTSIAMSVIDNIDKDVELVIFGASFVNRMQIADYNVENTLCWNFHDDNSDYNPTDVYLKSYNDARKNYVKYLYNETIGVNRSITAILSAVSIAEIYKSKFLYVLHDHNISLPPALQSKQIQPITETICLDRTTMMKRTGYVSEDGHPNDAGHALYFNEVIMPAVSLQLGLEL